MKSNIVSQGFRSSNSLSSNAFDVVHQVDAKYPALLFKQQLAAYVEKIYGIVRENMKKDLSPLLSSIIQVWWLRICVSFLHFQVYDASVQQKYMLLGIVS